MIAQEIKILSLSKNKKKYKVETINKTYLFDEETIIKYSIFPNKIFTIEEFNEILDSEETIKYFNKSLNYLAYQQRSRFEIYSYLKKQDVSDNKIKIIMLKLNKLGYIDDDKFSSNMLDYVIRQNKGPKVLGIKLKQKGIEEDIINKYLNIYDNSLQEDVLNKVTPKLIEKNNSDPIKKQISLIRNKFLRDGFTYDVINKITNNLKLTDKSEEKLPTEIDKLMLKYSKYDEKKKIQKVIISLMNKGYEYRLITNYIKNIE